jgi:hypothetical protein
LPIFCLSSLKIQKMVINMCNRALPTGKRWGLHFCECSSSLVNGISSFPEKNGIFFDNERI